MCISYTNILRSAYILIFKRSYPIKKIWGGGEMRFFNWWLSVCMGEGVAVSTIWKFVNVEYKRRCLRSRVHNPTIGSGEQKRFKRENRKVGFCLLMDTFSEQNVFPNKYVHCATSLSALGASASVPQASSFPFPGFFLLSLSLFGLLLIPNIHSFSKY